jgi:hypothetical protein
MNPAILFLPAAQSAAQVGAAVLQEAGKNLLAGGSSFAKMLTGDDADDDKPKKIDGPNDPSDPSAMLNLVDQIQNRLQSVLQSMGLQLDGDLNLSIDKNGKVSIDGDSDSAVAMEQIINSDPALQAKMGALKRACAASGVADQLKAKLRYMVGQLQFKLQQPTAADSAAADAAEPALAAA